MKKHFILLSTFILTFTTLLSQNSNIVDFDNKETSFNSLSDAMKDPSKVQSLFLYKSKDIPKSLLPFINLKSLMLDLGKNDSMPAGLKELNNLEWVVITAKGHQDWKAVFCGLENMNSFMLVAPLTNVEIKALEQCLNVEKVKIQSSLTEKESNVTKFNSVAEALEHKETAEKLVLINTFKDLDKIKELKHLKTLYIYSMNKNSMNLSTLLFPDSLTDLNILGGGSSKEIDLTTAHSIQKLHISGNYKNLIKYLPKGIENCTGIKEFELGNVRYAEEQVDSLLALFPIAKIKLNGITLKHCK